MQFNTLNLVRWEYLHDVNVEPTADSTSLTVEYCTCPNGHEGDSAIHSVYESTNNLLFLFHKVNSVRIAWMVTTEWMIA